MVATKGDKQDKANDVLAHADAEGVKFVLLQFVDIVGAVKSLTIPFRQFPHLVQNRVWFDGSALEGYARVAESDMFLRPDLETFVTVPWETGERKTARVLCAVETAEGLPFPCDPRYVLRRAVQEAESLGFKYVAGPELEFFLLQAEGEADGRVLPYDRARYFDISTGEAQAVLTDVAFYLQEMRIDVKTSHHEVGPGQHLVSIQHGDAFTTADNIVTLRYCLRVAAKRRGLRVTFMPKPATDAYGSALHLHQSLSDISTGHNAFHSAVDEYGLSDVARHFVAGQLAHAPGMCAVLSPLVNSYKRLVPGYEAPVYVSWGRVNRSALARVPAISPDRPESTRVEMRCSDASCNPYLAMAVMLKAGLDGINKRTPIPAPVEENLYEFNEKKLAMYQVRILPRSLEEALEELRQDEVIQEALGNYLYERFLEAKVREWNQYLGYVSPWEVERYLELV